MTTLQASLTLAAVFVVLFATISSCMDRRKHETNNVGCMAYIVAVWLLCIVSAIEAFR